MREDGFTVVEVLVASLIGFIVLSATLGLLDSTTRMSSAVMAKTDAMQRGRLAMDAVTRQLRSQVCVGQQPAIADGRADRVTFTADFGDGTTPADARTVALGPGGITETVEPGAGGPTRTNDLLENAALVADPATPFLQYFAYDPAASEPTPSLALPVPLSVSDRRRVARIEIAFVSRPTGETGSRHATTLTDQVIVRHADPNALQPDPACP